ncbi:MAG: tetratricopeptide repeat protein [Hyphomicrobiaceae bacterium]
MRQHFLLSGLVGALLLQLPAPAIGEEAGLARAKDAAAALQRGNAEQAIELYSEALKDQTIVSDRRASIHNDRGVTFQRLNLARQALEDFNRAVILFPEGAAAYNNRGNLLLSLGQAKEAFKDFDRALLLAPGYAAAYNNRANAFTRLGDPDAAIKDFSKAIQLSSTNPAPLNGRGRLHLAQNRPHAALRDFNRAVGLDARFGPGYRARAEAKLLLERYNEAAEDLSRAIAYDPSNVELHVLRGHAYLAADNAASALRDFDKATELDPNSASVHEAHGLANAKADAFDLALTDLARAIELDARSPLAYAYRAWVYKQQGQPELGQKDIDRAMRLDANRAEVFWVRGELREAAGENEEAIADLKKAVALKPMLRDASAALERLGVPVDTEDTEIPQLRMQTWRVYVRANRYHAASTEFHRLRVPLEMMSEGQPRLLEWDVKKPPLNGIGVLRFSAGKIDGARGPEDVEHAAVVDLQSGSVIALEPVRQGERMATWTWEDNRLVVASVDGYSEEYPLRLRNRDPAQTGQKRMTSTDGQGKSGRPPSWAPWGQDGFFGDNRGNRPRPSQPKTIFDLLFK